MDKENVLSVENYSTSKSFVLFNTDNKEVECVLMNLKDESATGWDEITTKLLKMTKTIIIPLLTHFFYCVLKAEFFRCH